MKFILKIFLSVALVFGSLYLFFRDTELWRNAFPQLASVDGSKSVENIALQLIMRKADTAGRTLNRVDVRDAYLQALEEKYRAITNEDGLATRESFLTTEKSSAEDYIRNSDTNGNKQLEWNEIKRTRWEGSAFTFASIDKNKDRSLSADEYWEYLKLRRTKWFQKNDKNGDSVLTKAEYDAVFPNRAADGLAFFQQLDTNRNSFLDENELTAAEITFLNN